MQHIIFNRNNHITITDEAGRRAGAGEKMFLYSEDLAVKPDITPYFDDECRVNVLILVKGVEIKKVIESISEKIIYVKAAGGIVMNEKDEILFMRRNNAWDMPKGHWEKGESIEETAVREVMEETGIKEIRQGNLLRETFHTYIMKGRREIKDTYWYIMHCSSHEKLIPQTEEGIETLVWVKKDDIDSVLKGSYPNIQDLFACIKDRL